MNRVRTQKQQEKEETVASRKSARLPIAILDPENLFTQEFLQKHYGKLIMIFVLVVIYIANSHIAERRIRRINAVENELKELRWIYITSKSELMYQSKQTEVARMVEGSGLKELTVSPRKIYVETGEH